jgi:hypothetical protein
VLARAASVLYRVDPHWAEQALLPRFDWTTNPASAAEAWQGLLSAGRLDLNLASALERPFLETAIHNTALGVFGDNYAAILASAGLAQDGRFTAGELRKALEALGAEGLAQVAKALSRALEAADDTRRTDAESRTGDKRGTGDKWTAGDKRRTYYANRIVPFFADVWPRTYAASSPAVAEALGELCIAADEDFPAAVELVRHWLMPVDFPYGLIHRLRESGLCERHPSAALRFLRMVVGDNCRLLGRELRACLDEICEAEPALVQDEGVERLGRLALSLPALRY